MSCADANMLRWILTHLNQELHVYLPRMLGGTVPDDWSEDYIGNPSYSLEKIMGDLESGKKNLLGLLDETKDESLNVEVDLFMGKKSLQFYVTLMISEIIHHEGQIAAILLWISGLEDNYKFYSPHFLMVMICHLLK